MRSHARTHGRAALLAAISISLLLAGQAVAATWASPVRLSPTASAGSGGLVTLAPSTVVAILESGAITARRSTDSGVTWGTAVPLANSGLGSMAAGYGSAVDVVWQEGDDLRYSRSVNGGASFTPPVAVSPAADEAHFPAVAHGPDSRVVIAWVDSGSANWAVRLRVSLDGGASFGATKTLASGSIGSPAVAIGKGVIYVAFHSDGALRVRRSTDSGSTWSSARVVANDQYGDPAHRPRMTASGRVAYVAYVAIEGGGPNGKWVRYVGTTDKGASWTAARNLSPAFGAVSYRESYDPAISVGGGVVRVAFARCLSTLCSEYAVFYRQSSNGTTWTKAYRASVASGAHEASAAGVGYAGRKIVLFTDWTDTNGGAWVRTSAP